MRKTKKDLNAYENDMINISNKEKEILESYNEDYIEYNEDDFNKIKNLYLKHKQPEDIVIYVKSNTTREDLITKAK